MVEHVFVTLRRRLAVALAGLDARAITPRHAAEQVEELAAIEKLAAGARLVLLARAARDQQWRQTGDVSAADHLARQAGTTPAAVNEAIKTSERLADLSATRVAATGGRLSPQQVAAVAAAASRDPDAEAGLLQLAASESLSSLREECGRVTAAATDQAERERIQLRNRSFRTWSGDDGSLCGRFSLPGIAGAELLAIFAPFREQAFAAARQTGRHETHDNYAADGFLSMARAADARRCSALRPVEVTNPVPRARPRARIQVRCDYFALRRGCVDRGEVAEIAGVGPISVPAVRELFDDSIVDILVTKGRDVTTIATNTRYIPQPLRIALAARDPVCFIAGCHRRYGLERDHQSLFSQTHDTSFTNLHRACSHHHDLKTNHGYQFVDTPDGWHCVPGQLTSADSGPDP